MPNRRLSRVRGMRRAEVGGRAWQEFLKLADRFRPSAGREMTDRELLRHFDEGMKPSSSEEAAGRVLARLYRETHPDNGSSAVAGLFPSLGQRPAITQAMEQRFPRQRRAIIRKADDACCGRFDLMGFNSLSFGDPIDWRLEPTSGRRTPLFHWSRIDYLDPHVAGDKKVTWELNRHQHFVTLGQAYWMTADERYAAAFVAQLISWMDANPPGRGINWASSLEVAFRLISWMWSLYLFSGSEQLTPGLVARLLKFAVAHARHIDSFTSHYFSPNTHLTGEALGLLYVGSALTELDRASYWRDRGIRILLEQLPLQVFPDGVYFERSTYYHRYTADFYTHLLLLTRADSTLLDRSVEESLASMLDHVMWTTRPDGRSPLIGDDDGGRLISLGVREADDFRDTLSTGAAICGRADWKHVASDAAVETLWLLGPAGLSAYDSMRSQEPDGRQKEFPQGGFFIMRDGWAQDSTWLIVNSGRRPVKSAAHAHSDTLSFELAALGKQWLLDPGTFTYTGSAQAREEFRSSRSHNAAVVDGVCHSESDGPFSWKRLAKGTPLQLTDTRVLGYFRGSHDGYMLVADPVKYARQVALIRSQPARVGNDRTSYLILSDEFLSNEPHSYELSFTFDPSCSVTSDGQRLIAMHQDGSKLEMFVCGTGLAHSGVESAFVSRCYGRREVATAGLIRSAGSGLQQLVSVILLSRAEPDRAVEFNEVPGREWIEATISSLDCKDEILIANSLRGPESGSDRFNGCMAFIRRRLGVLESAVLVDGDRFTAEDLSILSSTAIKHCEVAVRRERAHVTVQGYTPLDLEIRIAGYCLHIEVPGEQSEQVVRRSFELPRVAARSTGK